MPVSYLWDRLEPAHSIMKYVTNVMTHPLAPRATRLDYDQKYVKPLRRSPRRWTRHTGKHC